MGRERAGQGQHLLLYSASGLVLKADGVAQNYGCDALRTSFEHRIYTFNHGAVLECRDRFDTLGEVC